MWHPTVAPEALVESWDSSKGNSAISPLACLVKVVHPLGAPERGPGRCDNKSVGIVHPWGVYFEARASLSAC